jgi:hypothetical protein
MGHRVRAPTSDVLLAIGWVTTFLSLLVGYFVGENAGERMGIGDPPFDWQLGILAFAPVFVGGCVFVAAGAIMRNMDR